MTCFWTIACAVQTYLQRVSRTPKARAAAFLYIISLVLGLLAMLSTVLFVFCSSSFGREPFEGSDPTDDTALVELFVEEEPDNSLGAQSGVT